MCCPPDLCFPEPFPDVTERCETPRFQFCLVFFYHHGRFSSAVMNRRRQIFSGIDLFSRRQMILPTSTFGVSSLPLYSAIKPSAYDATSFTRFCARFTCGSCCRRTFYAGDRRLRLFLPVSSANNSILPLVIKGNQLLVPFSATLSCFASTTKSPCMKLISQLRLWPPPFLLWTGGVYIWRLSTNLS